MRTILTIELIILGTILFWRPPAESKSIVKHGLAKDQIDCKSRETSLAQLKAFASHKVACKGNNDEKFWRLACECSANDAGRPCPKCRISRDLQKHELSAVTDGGGLSHHSHAKGVIHDHDHDDAINHNRIDHDVVATEADYFSSKLKTAQNVTTLSNSANFIRFGK